MDKNRHEFEVAFAEEIQQDVAWVSGLWVEEYGCYSKMAECQVAWNMWQAARAQAAEQKLTKPVSIGGVRFHAGVDVSHVLRAAERRYEYEQSPDYKAQQADRVAQCMTAQPAGEAAALSAAAAALDMAHGIVSTQPSKPAGEAVALESLRALTSESGRKYVADFFINTLRRHDFTRYINEKLAADFACTLAVALHGLRTAPPAQVPDARLVEALEAVVEAGRMSNSSRARYCAEIASAALAAAPQPKGVR